MSHRIFTVDVFTEKPLTGNQLAVVLDAHDIPAGVMQRIAREMNISETTFVLPPEDPAHAARIRIFTPVEELPFAGHPTIGTAWVLATQGLIPGGALEFTLEENVGPVPVRGVNGPAGLAFWMTHPPAQFGVVFENRLDVAAAVGLTEHDLVAGVPIQVAQTGLPFLFVPLRDSRSVDAAAPDGRLLRALFHATPPLGVFIFASLGKNRLYSRMFAPHVSDIPEDPATGSASGPLGAFAVKSGLVPRTSTVSIVSEQGTRMGRQSFINIELDYGDSPETPTRIEVGGLVQPVISGTLPDFS